MTDPVTPPPRTVAVLLAAGSGSRVGADRNKVLLAVHGLPVLAHSVRTAVAVPGVVALVVVVRPGEEELVSPVVAEHAGDVPWSLVPGGATRHASEWSALRTLAPRIEAGEYAVVAVHDSARPLAGVDLWQTLTSAADRFGGAIPVRHQPGLLARNPSTDPGVLDLVGVQTPQAFRAGPLLAAYQAAERDGFEGTDTAACVARYTDLPIRAVPAPATNVKVTFPEDVRLAERLLAP